MPRNVPKNVKPCSAAKKHFMEEVPCRTLLVPLASPCFCTSFNRSGNRSAFRLPGAGGVSFPLYAGTFARSYSVSIFAPATSPPFSNFSFTTRICRHVHTENLGKGPLPGGPMRSELGNVTTSESSLQSFVIGVYNWKCRISLHITPVFLRYVLVKYSLSKCHTNIRICPTLHRVSRVLRARNLGRVRKESRKSPPSPERVRPGASKVSEKSLKPDFQTLFGLF